MRSTALQLEYLSWLPEGTAEVSSTPKDRFCDPVTATLGVHKFVTLLGCTSAETGLWDLRLTNSSHVVLIAKEWK